MKALSAILLLLILGASPSRAVIFPAVELTPENAGKEGFEIRAMSTTESDSIRIVIGFVKVPTYLEERCKTELRVRDGNKVSLEATLQPASEFRGTKVAYSFKIPKDLLPRAELYMSEGNGSSSDHRVIIPLAKFLEVK